MGGTSSYNGGSNCDNSSPALGVLRLQLAIAGSHYSRLLYDNYIVFDMLSAQFAGPGGPNGLSPAGQDGMIFRFDSTDIGGQPDAILPFDSFTRNNWKDSGSLFPPAPCTFPDPTIDNFVAYGGSVTVTSICTVITITSSTSDTVPNTAGSGSVVFIAVNPDTGASGDWYAAKALDSPNPNHYVIVGTGTFLDDLTFTSATTGTGGATVTFSWTANTTGFARIFYVVINNKEYTLTQSP